MKIILYCFILFIFNLYSYYRQNENCMHHLHAQTHTHTYTITHSHIQALPHTYTYRHTHTHMYARTTTLKFVECINSHTDSYT